MKSLILLLSIIIFCSCTHIKPHPRAWTKQEKVAATFFVVAHTLNAYTTERHQDYPDRFYEINPMLGRHPRDSQIATYFGLTGLGVLLLTHFYPELRAPLLWGYGGANGAMAIHDYRLIRK